MKRKLLYIFFFLVMVWFGGFIAFDHAINNITDDKNTKTEAIVVLTGGRNRIAEAVKLLNNAMAEKLFISGVFRGISLKQLENRQDIKVTTSREITLDEKSTNTVENAIEANAWIKQNQINQIRLVTSNYHLPRSLIEFKLQNRDLVIVPHPVYSDKVARQWWKSPHSFGLLLLEYNKFLFVWLKSFF